MNTTNLYTELYAYSQSLEPGEAKIVAEMVERGETTNGTISPVFTLSNILVALREEVEKQAAKATGSGELRKVAAEIAKAGVKGYHAMAPVLVDKHIIVIENTRILRALSADVSLPGIGHDEERAKKVARLLDTTSELAITGGELELPTAACLKIHIAAEKKRLAEMYASAKSRPKPEWDFGEGKPLVDAAFLLGFVVAIPDAKMYYNRDNTNMPIYIKGKKADAVLAPIRRKA